MKKISVLGDIMCERPFLIAATKRNYDFYTTFSNLESLLAESDYVIGNLETPIAGEELIYTNDLYSFNTPSAFLDDLKKLKINLYLTANNHCIDRGVKGLENTLYELDKRKMQHTGTSNSDNKNIRSFTIEIGNTKCAFLSYNTYINEEQWSRFKHNLYSYSMNCLIDNNKLFNYREYNRSKTIHLYKIRKWLSRFYPANFNTKLKIKFGIKFHPYIDNEPLSEIQGDYLIEALKVIKERKQHCDLVFVFPHCGGQFNILPGKTSKELFQILLDNDVDAVIASHAHVIQDISFFNGKPCVYSLGNVSMSPSSPYIVKTSLPQYGLIFHVYIDNKSIAKTSFSIIKTIEDPDHYPMVYPIDELAKILDKEQLRLLKCDVSNILGRITGVSDTQEILREYELTQKK